MGALPGVLFDWLAGRWVEIFADTWVKSLSTDYRNDPTYKANLQRLIEQNRKFKDAKE